MIIKVCGLGNNDNIKAVTALNPEYVGFIYYRPSPRFVGELDEAAIANIPSNVIKTGVFVNEPAENINRLIDKYHFDAIQLHGAESPEFCGSFQDKVKVIKAFGIYHNFDFGRLDDYVGK